MITPGMFSSKTIECETPQWLFDALNKEFSFTLDVCANEQNAKCARFFTQHDDGLSQEWRGTCWMNPPYGRMIGKWIKKAYESSLLGSTVVCLVPARTDTAWWQDYILDESGSMHASEIRFLRGRLKFGGQKGSAPFPSAIVIYRGKQK